MGGRIAGILDGNTVTGTWHQTNGEGVFVFVFASDFSSFKGKWAGKGQTPFNKWDGKKLATETFKAANGSSPNKSSDTENKVFGNFNSDFGVVTFKQTNQNVTASYTHSNGRIIATLNGQVLTGTWIQDNGKGRLRFVFNSDFNSFVGKWSYNNETPAQQWNGTK